MPKMLSWLLLSSVALSCSATADSETETPDAAEVGPDVGSAERDAGEERDAGAERDVASDASMPQRLATTASNGEYPLTFSITIDGTGTGRVGRALVDAGAGSLEIDGVERTLGVYERQEWTEFGYTLYQAIAVSPDAWHIVWFYCQGPELTDVWIEGTDTGVLETVTADGTCAGSDDASTVDVSFPATDLAIPPLVGGFTVDGSDLEIGDAAPGTVAIGATVFDVFAFSHVDCTQECGSPGWHELHALLWDPRRQWLCFGIFYLFLDARPVLLAYGFSLPVLTAPFGTVEFDGATWSD